jgi:phosphoribosyl-ATP pyrophosphohydrolase
MASEATDPSSAQILERLGATIAARGQADPATSYVASLFAQGQDAILKKVAEEAAETLLAAKDGDKLHLIRETADLWFHCMVLLAWHGAQPADVLAELQRREGASGIEEKKARG